MAASFFGTLCMHHWYFRAKPVECTGSNFVCEWVTGGFTSSPDIIRAPQDLLYITSHSLNAVLIMGPFRRQRVLYGGLMPWHTLHGDIIGVTNTSFTGSRTLSILYSCSVRTISILQAERVCWARPNKSEDLHNTNRILLMLHRHHHISVSH